MIVLRFVLFFFVFILVKIGDGVILLLNIAKNTVLYFIKKIFSLRKFLRIKSKSGTFDLRKKETSKKIISPKIFLESRIYTLKRAFLGFSNSTSSIISKIVISIISFIVICFRQISAFFKRLAKTIWKIKPHKKEKKEEDIKSKKKYARPSFSYNIKLIFLGFIFSTVFIFLPLLTLIFLSDLPSPSNLSVNFIPKTTKIYDKNGNLLYEIYANQNRTIVALSEIPKNLKNATIAIEDKDFYTHPGFDVKGIARAFISNTRNKNIQGGSTITQQLIKSAFFSSEPSIARKVKEIVLAFWAERLYSKDKILELYFNYVPYGGTAWGIESASEIYFGKNVTDLSLGESAFLAGLPRAPSAYSPYFGNGKLWKKRQKEVLDAMVHLSYIKPDDGKKALEEDLQFKTPNTRIKAPHFVMYVRDWLIQKYGLSEVERGGLQVKTTLDLPLQEKIEQIVASEIDQDAYLNIHNGAALITNPSTGDILSMVGSKNYFDTEAEGNVNIVTASRQPGSTIKLVTYALALSTGFTEATILDDTPLTIYSQGGPSYTPVNYDGAFHGRIPLRTAFANSFNIPAVRTAQKMGVDNIVNFGRDMGISSWKDSSKYGISITLGGAEVTMKELATAYGTIANEGKRVDINPILEVKDALGKILYQKSIVEKQVVDPGVAFIISDILADNNARSIEFGSNSPLSIPGKRVSVKTGTTDYKRDNWTIGYTKNVLVATWVGNNDNSPMSQSLVSGITGAAPMWNKIISSLMPENNESNTPPPNIVKKYCLGQDRFFIKGSENTVLCVMPTPIPSPTPQ